ncbi:MAG TPA: AAA family ATPase [Archangium sp.]|uniref:AAA family ATPase n=1 Tax=Archangium sp. TaxID=1872627 RepID=UPI002E2FFD55|nr:AAA family ATPase [Archangium sp.]HEX5747628.1 AAA family ATPase [Archangium sp.]
MANARLTAIEIERFKSYRKRTRVEFAPLTVLLGRNNSGKSTLIQALLLLKQTLALPRPEVPLHLEGMVDALSLRELTSGWPEGPEIQGPSFSLEWTSTVDIDAALEQARSPDLAELRGNTGLEWLMDAATPKFRSVTTRLTLEYAESNGKTILKSILLASLQENSKPSFFIGRHQESGQYACFWHSKGWSQYQHASKLSVELEHFLPYLLIERRNVGPRDRQRSWHNAFLLLFAQPLEDLKALLTGFSYLGSIRTLPPSLYRPATVPPEEIGISGEYAAQMLHARRADAVHYLPPLHLKDDQVVIPDTIRESALVDGVNDVLRALGVDTSLEVEEVRDVGFRLLFGRANLQHVGRGLSYLLPVIQLGLISDPLRFKTTGPLDLETYREKCPSYGHCAFEEPEAHLHPKVQTRLAHWLVALAMARRQLLVETHSDHLVRRLRGLIARAGAGSELERWLLENIRVLQVEQTGGESEVQVARLTTRGGLEEWPSDFMDEATGEERSIYHAALDKPEETMAVEAPPPDEAPVEHDVGEEPEP